MSDTRKFVKAWWFHAGISVYGIVETIDDLGNTKHYIGAISAGGSDRTMRTEEEDAMVIAQRGARFRIPSDLSTEHDAP